MSLSINPRSRQIKPPGIRQFSNQLIHYPDAVNLTVGQPDFPTPEAVKQAGIAAILADQTGYSHNAGLPALREAASHFISQKFNATYDPIKEIIVTNGATEAIDSIFRTILEPGDEVIIPAPIYSGYEPLIELSGARVVYLDTSLTGLQPDAYSIEQAITPATKAILFNNPSNPTGVTMDKQRIDEIVEVLKNKDLFILSDEIYSENVFDGQHVSFASYPEIRRQLFLIHGVSKSHSMTGWRIGFVFGDAEWIATITLLHAYNTICASVPAQHATIEALTGSIDAPLEMNKAYRVRRDFVYDRLLKLGMEVEKPQGAFYIFPSIRTYGLSSFDFATRLLQEGGVAVVPGSVFTPFGEGFIRISFAYSMEQLILGMDRLEAFILNLQRETSSVISASNSKM